MTETQDEEQRKLNDPDSEELEKRRLLAKANVLPFVIAATEGKQVDGAELELRSAIWAMKLQTTCCRLICCCLLMSWRHGRRVATWSIGLTRLLRYMPMLWPMVRKQAYLKGYSLTVLSLGLALLCHR